VIKFLDLQKITSSFEPGLSDAISGVLKRGWFLLGEETAAFESEYADFIGCDHCITTANGLDALRLILKAYIEMGTMKEGDEVIVPANTFIATVLAVTDNRLRPVFVEPDPGTYNIDIDQIEGAISDKTRAIIVVHLYGQAVWSEKLEQIAKTHDLKIIEDNAQAAGATVVHRYGSDSRIEESHASRRTGSLGDAAGHSFYPGKNLGALGDGGAVTTDDSDLATVVRSLANYGSVRKYVHNYRGINSRLDELQAAVLRVKLPRLDSDNQHRREVSDYYHLNIKNRQVMLPGVSLHQTTFAGTMPYFSNSIRVNLCHVWHLFVVRHPDRDRLREYLEQHGIQTLIHYPIPPHLQKAYSEYAGLKLPVTERIHREVLSLPISQVMTQNEADAVVKAINEFK
jgi:dTDP-4-amino-4,6-dideoxygalactose transaminase